MEDSNKIKYEFYLVLISCIIKQTEVINMALIDDVNSFKQHGISGTGKSRITEEVYKVSKCELIQSSNGDYLKIYIEERDEPIVIDVKDLTEIK